MNPLVQYYVRQAGRGVKVRGRGDNGIGPIYSIALFVQRGHGIGSSLSGLFRTVRPILWSGAKSLGRETVKALGREALRTGGKILTDIADNPQTGVHDVISKHVSETTQNIIQKLRGGGRKRKMAPSRATRKTKRAKITKRKASTKTSKTVKRKPRKRPTTKRDTFA